ncbi:MAG: clan AA aspartic protease [Nitrospinae bacterium]|nr:clan AA aspartic protease [Nitrospinota bacterium]
MGVTHVTVTLKGFGSPSGTYAADFLVDTGATDSLAPAAELRNIGVQPVGTMVYELADGTIHEYPFGLVQIEFMGEITAGRVIFGPDNAEPLLGVTALESVGITVDPANRTLKRLPAIPLKQCKARVRVTGVVPLEDQSERSAVTRPDHSEEIGTGNDLDFYPHR